MTAVAHTKSAPDVFAPVPASTILLGLIGAGIQLSRTPRMHESEAAAQGLKLVYRLIDLEPLGAGVEALPVLLDSAQRAGYAGLNITHPCKQAVIPLLDDLSADARALGAVNTVVFSGGKRIGHNTDWWGFAESFKRGLPDAATDNVVQLGAGGAGSAVAYALLTAGIGRLTVFDVDFSRASLLAGALTQRFGAGRITARDVAPALASADGLVNTTPVGMAKYPGLPLAVALLRRELWVADIVYFPLETALLRQARALGCRTLDGSGMAVFQAVEAFRLITGRAPDAARMAREFAALGGAAP